LQDQARKEQADQSGSLLGDIFGSFIEARKGGSKEAFEILQGKIAEHAGELVRLQLSSLKEIVDTLMKLDGVAKDEAEADESNDLALQKFLKKAEDQEGKPN